MIIKTLFLVLLVYLVIRVVLSLIRAVIHDRPGQEELRPGEGATSHTGEVRARDRVRHRARERDVEDAQWVDL